MLRVLELKGEERAALQLRPVDRITILVVEAAPSVCVRARFQCTELPIEDSMNEAQPIASEGCAGTNNVLLGVNHAAPRVAHTFTTGTLRAIERIVMTPDPRREWML